MRDRESAKGVALVGAMMGLLVSTVVWTLSLTLWGDVSLPSDLLKATGFAAVWAGPHALALAALALPDRYRAGIWLSTGVCVLLLAGMFLLSGFGFLLIPGAILLIVGGARTPASGWAFVSPLVATVLIGAVSVAGALFLRDEACWYRVLGPERDTWVRRPFTTISGGPRTPEATCGAFASPEGTALAVGAWLVPIAAVLLAPRLPRHRVEVAG